MFKSAERYKFLARKPFNIEVSTKILDGDCVVHAHEYTEVTIVLSGTATHIVCGKEYLIGPGDVFVINPDATHGFTNARDLFHYKVNYMREALESMNGGILQMSGYQALFVLGGTGGSAGFPCRLKLGAQDLQWCIKLVQSLERELNDAEPGCETMSSAYFMEFIVGLARRYSHEMGRQTELNNIEKIAILASYLEKHCLEPISSIDMVRVAGLSERQLRRLFNKHYQTSPLEYLLRLRIRHAANLLVFTSKTVSEIAFASAFHEDSYFCRRFRKYTGLSPLEYRRQNSHHA